MPIVEFSYTKEGEKNARAAARMHGGKYISDKKGKGKGIGVVIAVGPVKKSKKKSPARRTRKKA